MGDGNNNSCYSVLSEIRISSKSVDDDEIEFSVLRFSPLDQRAVSREIEGAWWNKGICLIS
jgi:hypothetical protein